MIRWCSYCQRYQGESPPFDDFALTHGICDSCLAADIMMDSSALDRIQPVVSFFRRVANAHRHRESSAALLEEGLGLGIGPWDLLLGVIQPALQSMGRRWASALAAVSDEHVLTATCAEILALMNRQPGLGALRRSAIPEILLVNAEGNFHTLGIQFVEFFLLTRGIHVQVIYPGLPTREVVELVRSARPRKLGISCSLPAQLDSARRTAEAIVALPEEDRPQVFVGGFALHASTGVSLPGPFRICRIASDLLDAPTAAGP